MNNTDFRKILFDGDTASNTPETSSTGIGPAAGRSRGFIPQTPRTVKGQPSFDFARQAVKHYAPPQASKKFRSAPAPKGSKLAAGYTDRARERNGAESSTDDRESRLKALEEQVKLGQIEQEVFEKLRDEITGGDLAATHLIKGLDRRLLERVRRGEDVLDSESNTPTQEPVAKSVDEDKALEDIERQNVTPVEREQVHKKGEHATSKVAGVKRTRDDILAELKASRQAQQEASAKSQLSARFSKIGDKKASSRVEKDQFGREVLITVDEEGRVKRKVRKPQKELGHLLVPDAVAQPLGMVVPVQAPEAELEDDDIFENVGVHYNPLGDLGASDDSSSDEAPKSVAKTSELPDQAASRISQDMSDSTASLSHVAEKPQDHSVSQHAPAKPNYFSNAKSENAPSRTFIDPLHDPTIAAAIKRAAAIPAPGQDGPPTSKAAHRLIASSRDRDLDDLDLGFGSSRMEDEDDDGLANSRLRLSEWKGSKGGDDEDGGKGGKSGKGRDQGKKKKKKKGGSAADIFRVIEQRKSGAK